jgi:integrase
MAAMTGLRQGELLAVRWGDLDFVSHKVRVRRAFVRGEYKAPKSVRGVRGVPLAAELEESLLRFSEVSASPPTKILSSGIRNGDPLDRSKVRKRFQRACRSAGVRVVRFHDLRHTFGTRLAASGEVSLRTLQEWMGHRDAKTTLISADGRHAEGDLRRADLGLGSREPLRHCGLRYEEGVSDLGGR